jgi:hypothetical protein
VDIQLEVGAVTVAVTVSTTNPQLETDTTVVGQIMENEARVKSPQGHLVRLPCRLLKRRVRRQRSYQGGGFPTERRLVQRGLLA